MLLLYSPSISHRLKYVSDFIGKELTGKPFELTADVQHYEQYPGPRINYSPDSFPADKAWLRPHPLLFETGIRDQQPVCFQQNGVTGFFKTDGDFPFDIFAAVFYLLSRYEEYLPHQKDMYGRYAHENSLAYKEGFLDQPLVNTWLQMVAASLRRIYPDLPTRQSKFKFLPTYDIDEAYSFRHKEWSRSTGAALRDLLRGKVKRFAQRRRVLNNKEADPFDSYTWMDDLHRPYSCKPWYFFLVPAKTGKHDHNILPQQTALQTLIRQHADKYKIGVHPSWQSGDKPELLNEEIRTIEHITQLKVDSSRQHFIRFSLPDTFRRLIEAGIREDFSMGYGSINGFRASVASRFYWYDLEKEQATPLLLYPFCYMEANSYYEQKQSPAQALREMQHYYHAVKNVGGTLITIWHNTFLGTDVKFKGWREAYLQFFHEVVKESHFD